MIKMLLAAGRTDRGNHRKENQDSLLSEIASQGSGGIFAVADGMGGHKAGEIASAIAIETLREDLAPLLADQEERETTGDHGASGAPIIMTVQQAIERCNERILKHAQEYPDTQGLGSTLTLAVVRGSLAIIGNVGDSRTYRVRDGEIERLTRDHSLVAHLADIGEIEPDDVYSHPQRSYIYRALGTDTEVQPDIFTERLQEGDTLLLCSDGLWEMVRDNNIVRTLEEANTIDEAADALIQLANNNGGDDNISVVIVKVG